MSTLTDALKDVEAGLGRYPGPQCTVAKILEQISADDRDRLNRLLDNPDIPGSLIADALTRNGHTVSDKTILRHRRRSNGGGCRCPREAAE
jgi:hypothetical protein